MITAWGYPINISLVSLMESKITSCGCSIGITWMMRLMFSLPLSRGWSNDNGMPTRLSRITQMVTLCLYADTVQLTAMISMDCWANISFLQPVTVDYFTGFLWAIWYDRYTATEVMWWNAWAQCSTNFQASRSSIHKQTVHIFWLEWFKNNTWSVLLHTIRAQSVTPHRSVCWSDGPREFYHLRTKFKWVLGHCSSEALSTNTKDTRIHGFSQGVPSSFKDRGKKHEDKTSLRNIELPIHRYSQLKMKLGLSWCINRLLRDPLKTPTAPPERRPNYPSPILAITILK